MDEADVRQSARSFVAKVDISNIREDLSPYVTAANAKIKRDELGEGESGYTITKPNGKHIITVNSLETDERQRFTICHEIAHIVLGLESSHEEVPSWSYAKRHPNEIACDTFASELLMPYKQWLSAVPKEEPSLGLIQHMADLFGTSFPAAASKFASLSDIPCAFVTMERGTVRYAARSTALRQAGAWIPQDRSFQQAPWLTKSALQGIARLRRGKFHRTSGSTTGKRALTSGSCHDITSASIPPSPCYGSTVTIYRRLR